MGGRFKLQLAKSNGLYSPIDMYPEDISMEKNEIRYFYFENYDERP